MFELMIQLGIDDIDKIKKADLPPHTSGQGDHQMLSKKDK